MKGTEITMKTKLIFSPQLAQWLLHEGFSIVELKPKRNSPKETVFVFEEEDGFYEAITIWTEAKEDYDNNETAY